MLLDLLTHILALDFPWLFSLVTNNLAWVFVLALLAHFIYGKGPILGTAFVGIYLFATLDLASILGWVFRKETFFWVPILGFLALLFYDSFFQKNSWHSKLRGTFAGLVFYCALILLNVFWG